METSKLHWLKIDKKSSIIKKSILSSIVGLIIKVGEHRKIIDWSQKYVGYKWMWERIN